MPTKIQISKSGLTQFQIKVLQTLQSVPKGRVVTYRGLARAVGQSTAMRAVANALNRNPWIVQVPCHRVVRSDGTIGGYAKGVKAKIAILKKEGVVVEKEKIVDFEKKIYRFN